MTKSDLECLVLVKKNLLTLPYARENTQRTHVLVRCPVCGDSHKSISGTHCYINIEGSKPITYYCFLCNNGGYLNSSILRTMGITSSDIITGVKIYNREFLKRIKNMNGNYGNRHNSGIVDISAKTIVPPFNQTNNSLLKLKYINDRLGTDIRIDDAHSLKIVLSLKEFIEANYLNVNPTMIKSAKLLEDDYVGVLSLRGEYITFRNIYKNKNYRYIIYPVFQYNTNSNKLYIIPNSDIDIMSNDVTLNLTEGFFDILSCYINLNNRKNKNTIYGAVCGCGYLNMITHIARLGFIGNLNLNIYSDTTVPPAYYKNILERKNLFNDISLYYNRYPNEKDIGVPLSKIDIKKTKI